jgi:hypothetical protein
VASSHLTIGSRDRRARCLFVDGRFIDELDMAALLPGG